MTEEKGIELFGESWYKRLRVMLDTEVFEDLGRFIARERKAHTVYPAQEDIFKAFRECPYDNVKVVILGQDPYGDSSATGIAFANDNFKHPLSPSLQNILLEVENDVYQGFHPEMTNANLLQWCHQGVLLLNTALTVREREPNSHAKQWSFFTEHVIELLDSTYTGLIFMLWGKHAQSYLPKIDALKHHTLISGHPVTPSYGKDTWFGNKHFSQANTLLEQMNGKDAIIKW